MRRLNLGCGNDYREGWDNADFFAKKADLRFDFELRPYPIKDNTYDYIYCSQVLEHLRNPEIAMMEIYRILKKGGTAEIFVPHYTTAGDHNFRHHSHFATCAIMDFVKGHEAQNEVASQMDGAFELVSATRKLRGIHWNIGGFGARNAFLFDFVPVWDSILWVVRK